MDCIRLLDPEIADRYSEIYEIAIDRGAHPNIEGVTLTETVTDISETDKFVEIAILSGDTAVIRETLNSAICAGALVRDLIMRLFKSWDRSSDIPV